MVAIPIAKCKGDQEDGLPSSISIGNVHAQLLNVLLCCLHCLPLLLLYHLGSCGAFVVVSDASACQTGLWLFPVERLQGSLPALVLREEVCPRRLQLTCLRRLLG